MISSFLLWFLFPFFAFDYNTIAILSSQAKVHVKTLNRVTVPAQTMFMLPIG